MCACMYECMGVYVLMYECICVSVFLFLCVHICTYNEKCVGKVIFLTHFPSVYSG